MSQAKEQKAIGLFEAKYGDVVRVVSVGDFSKELCGGTHVNNTSELGLFVIESEESIGSGIRRMTTRTSQGAYDFLQGKQQQLQNLGQLLQVNDLNKAPDKVTSLFKDIDDLSQQLNQLNQKMLSTQADNLLENESASLVFEMDLDSKLVKEFMDLLKAKAPNRFIFGLFKANGPLNLAAYVPKDLITKGLKAGDVVKEAAQLAGGNGGGRPDFAQAGAKDLSKAGEILAFVSQKVSSLL